MSEIGRPGQHVDVFHGGDVGTGGRLLTIAEIAEELRRLSAGPGTGRPLPGDGHDAAAAGRQPVQRMARAHADPVAGSAVPRRGAGVERRSHSVGPAAAASRRACPS